MIALATDQSVPVYWVLGVLRLIEDQAVADMALADAELTREALLEEGALIAHRKELAFIDAAAHRLGNPLFGVEAGFQIDPRRTSLLSYLILNSERLGDGIANLTRYLPLVRTTASVRLEVRAEEAALAIETENPLVTFNRQHSEFAMSATLAAFRVATGRLLVPLRVQFVHPEHHEAPSVEQAFGCPVAFGQRRFELVLKREDLELPLVDPDLRLLKILVDHADALLAKLKRAPDSYRSQVERLILARLQEGAPTIEDLGKSLGIGARTLARRLEDEGCHLREILDHLRFELAQAYMADPGLNLAEIAFLLGYADQSAFSTAFKRWSGVTPGGWRRSPRG